MKAELITTQGDAIMGNARETLSALRLAISTQATETLQNLLSELPEGFDIDSQYNDMSSLSYAAYLGAENAVTLLLSKGAEINKQNSHGQTALMHAVRGGHINIVKLLLDKEANLNLQAADGSTALQWASYGDKEQIACMLKAKGATLGKKPLQRRCKAEGATKLSQELIEEAALRRAKKRPQGFIDIALEKETRLYSYKLSLFNAILFNRLGELNRLLALKPKGFDINQPGSGGATLLYKARCAGCTEACDILLAHGADPATDFISSPAPATPTEETSVPAQANTLNTVSNMPTFAERIARERESSVSELQMQPSASTTESKTKRFCDFISGRNFRLPFSCGR